MELTIDHVVPTALGGNDEAPNLVTACRDCNSGKSSVPADASIVDDVAQDAIRWAHAMEIAAQERAAARTEATERHNAFLRKWNSWTYEYRGERFTFDLPTSWKQNVDQFLDAGLDMDALHELIDVAMEARANDDWRYFCGCCWKRIRQLQDRAAEIVSAAADSPRDIAVMEEAEALLDG